MWCLLVYKTLLPLSIRAKHFLQFQTQNTAIQTHFIVFTFDHSILQSRTLAIHRQLPLPGSGLQLLALAPQSADINTIEHIGEHGVGACGKADLHQVMCNSCNKIYSTWQNLDEAIIQNVIDFIHYDTPPDSNSAVYFIVFISQVFKK